MKIIISHKKNQKKVPVSKQPEKAVFRTGKPERTKLPKLPKIKKNRIQQHHGRPPKGNSVREDKPRKSESIRPAKGKKGRQWNQGRPVAKPKRNPKRRGLGDSLLKKAVAVTAAVTVTGCAVFHVGTHFQETGDKALLMAAGFAVPDGAAGLLRENLLSGDSVSQAGTVAPETVSSVEIPLPESKVIEEVTETSSQVVEGIPIEETQLSNTGTEFRGFYVNNKSEHHQDVDIEASYEARPDIHIKKDGTPQVLIYHTHTSESFLPTDMTVFPNGFATRTTDNNLNVVAVGEKIAEQLRAAGIGVIHDTTVHDASYNGSYSRSIETMEKNLEQYPTIQVTLDVHRDALGDQSVRYKPVVEVDGKKAAQIMIISGCDDDGAMGFPDWEYNFRFALRLQDKNTELYGDIMRPLLFGAYKYNEHMTRGSLLVEFGTEVNSIDEVCYSGELFGKALVEVLESLMDE